MDVRAAGREQRLHSVKQAAWSLFVARGFESTTIRQIATEAGVSTGTVMSFGAKSELLLELFEDAIGDRIGAAPAQPDGPVDAVWMCYRPYFDFFDSHPPLARAYASVLFSGGEQQPSALGEKANAFNAFVAQVIVEHCPTTSADGAHLTAESIFATYMHALMLWATGWDSPETAAAMVRRQISWQISRFDQD